MQKEIAKFFRVDTIKQSINPKQIKKNSSEEKEEEENIKKEAKYQQFQEKRKILHLCVINDIHNNLQQNYIYCTSCIKYREKHIEMNQYGKINSQQIIQDIFLAGYKIIRFKSLKEQKKINSHKEASRALLKSRQSRNIFEIISLTTDDKLKPFFTCQYLIFKQKISFENFSQLIELFNFLNFRYTNSFQNSLIKKLKILFITLFIKFSNRSCIIKIIHWVLHFLQKLIIGIKKRLCQLQQGI